MRFTPKTDEEIKAASPDFEPWPIGDVDFEIAEAIERQSAAGNDMIELKMLIFNHEGRRRVISDYLLSNQQWKLKQACYSCGMHAAYDNGVTDAEDFVGRTGKLKIGVQPASEQYKAKNKVTAYIASSSRPTERHERVPATADLDDEIPF